MNSFSISRCYTVARRQLRSNLRRYAYMVIGLAIGLFLLEILSFSTHGGLHYISTHETYFYENLASTLWVACFFASFAFMALTFSHLRTKQNRIAYLMLPATNAEKFVAHIGIAVVMSIVGFALAYVVADLSRMLLLLLLGGDTTSMIPYFLQTLGHTGESFTASDGSVKWDVLLFLIGILLWNYSCHLLGSVVFRRWAFVKTIGVQILVAYLLGLSISATNTEFSLHIGYEGDKDLIVWIFIGANFLFAALHTWLAYWLHSRLVVIPRRWFAALFKIRHS